MLDTLKQEYFELSLKERYPHTPKITENLDMLEFQIHDLIYSDPCKEQEELEG